jgi:hypothetical protein
MIEVSLMPARLLAEQPNDLRLQLTNIGRGPCTSIVLRLAWPSQIILLQGPDRIEESRLDPGQSIVKALRVRPKQAGTWQLTSPNFSYRDQRGQPQRITDMRLDLMVEPAPALPPKPPTLPPHRPSKPIDLALLRQNMVVSFSDSELRNLCFDLGIDAESLALQNKADLVRELIVYCQRRDRLAELLAYCRQQRPMVGW